MGLKSCLPRLTSGCKLVNAPSQSHQLVNTASECREEETDMCLRQFYKNQWVTVFLRWSNSLSSSSFDSSAWQGQNRRIATRLGGMVICLVQDEYRDRLNKLSRLG